MRKEQLVDLFMSAIMVKVKALNDVEKGMISANDVTKVDRLIIILGSFAPKYQEKIVNMQHRDEDVGVVLKMAQAFGVELSGEEIITFAKVRRYLINKVNAEGVALFLEKFLNTDTWRPERMYRVAK